MTEPDAMYQAIAHAALARCQSEARTRRILAGFELELRYTAPSNTRALEGLGYVVGQLREKLAKSWPGLPDVDPERYP